MDTLAATLLMISGIFLILLVLVQRGRGGGLAGAFGGMGGQSAFGTKAGDVFTKITVIVAVVWVLLAGGSILAFRASTGGYEGNKPKDNVDVLKSMDEVGSTGTTTGELPADTEEKKVDPAAAAEETPGKKPDAAADEPAADAKKTEEKPAETPSEAEKPDSAPDAEKPADEKPAEEPKNE